MFPLCTAATILLCASADDPKLAEFLDLMKPRSKGALWANDDPAAAPSATKQPQQQPGSEARQPKRKRAAIEADATAAAAEVSSASACTRTVQSCRASLVRPLQPLPATYVPCTTAVHMLLPLPAVFLPPTSVYTP